MAKKKRQAEPSPNDNSCGSSESSEDMKNLFSHSECKHIAKSVDLSSVKKALAGKLSTECQECNALPPQEEQPMEAGNSSEMVEFDVVDDSLWMCLKCGHQACGRYKNKHALQHYNTPHSDKHSLCLNTTKWCVWCYQCDNEVQIDGKKKLHECVEYIKKFANAGKKLQEVSVSTSNSDEALVPAGKPATVVAQNNGEFVARGLSNLGNTCFFNSVMQCLGQTPYLLTLLEETAVHGQKFRLPGGKVILEEDPEKSIEVEPLEGTLEEWKALTRVLAETLRELQSGRVDVHNPRGLFQALTQRISQFGGGDQHDSHELLRHLLDAVREEDLRRYQHVILKHVGLSSKTDPATVEGEKRKIIRFYGSQASDLQLPTEQVFRGVLVSTLECQECGHKSYREEFFLDLSLPIAEKQSPPMLRRKADDCDEGKASKHQLKKDKRAARKNAKRGQASGKPKLVDVATDTSNPDTPMEVVSNENLSKSASESDADVEDNVDDSGNSRTPDEGTTKGTESGYNSDKNSSDQAEFPAFDAASPVVGMLSASPFSPDSPSTSPGSSENLDVGSPSAGHNSPAEENIDLERPESRLAFSGVKNMLSIENLTIEQDSKPEVEGAVGGDIQSDAIGDTISNMEVDEVDMYNGTISIAHIEEGECSVQSCLNQFTNSELMIGNNKVGCEHCTKHCDGPDKKTKYTNARKQLLIYNPPAVLILHLKRFQVNHFRPSKILKFVKFPIILDIAPFCTKRALKLPNLAHDQKQVLYSLYGVVEHSGSLHGGHYVAYVKVRPQPDEDSYRWQFLPKNHRLNLEKKVEQTDMSRGKWFYVSDSHAAEINESRVLNTNAYLLFYERIL